MASKEALFIALDVSDSMRPHLDDVTGAVQRMLCDRIFHSKQDAVGLLKAGADATDNEVALQMGGYDHIAVVGSMGPVGMKRIENVGAIHAESGRADLIDAVVVAADAIARYVRKNKWSKRVLLVSDGATSRAELDEEQVADIASQLADNDIVLEVAALGPLGEEVRAARAPSSAAGPPPQSEAGETWAALARLGARLDALGKPDKPKPFVAREWSEAKRVWSEPRAKATKSTAAYRGPLALGGSGGGFLPVRVWRKVAASNSAPVLFKSVTKTRAAAAADDGAAAPSESVKSEVQWVLKSDLDTQVRPDEMVASYRYGRDVIPVAGALEEKMRYGVPEKCLELHGFVPRASVPRHYLLGPSEVLVGDDAVAGADKAVQALCYVLDEERLLGIARYARSKGLAPRLAVLWPSASGCLHLNILPFSDEVKALQWPPLPPSLAAPPSAEQRAAADALVDALDLDAAAWRGADAEARISELEPQARALLRRPKDVLNPQHARLQQIVVHRALHKSEALPPPPPRLVAPLQPGEDLFTAARPAAQRFAAACPTGELRKPGKRVFKEAVGGAKRPRAGEAGGGRESPGGGKSGGKSENGGGGGSGNGGEGGGGGGGAAVEDLPPLGGGGGGLRIDSGRPVECFWQMVSTGESAVLLDAMAQMRSCLLSLLDKAGRPDDPAARKGFDCLRALRSACIKEDEPDKYNELLKSVKAQWLGESGDAAPSREPFWRVLCEDSALSAGLISSSENDDSSVSAAEARAFLRESSAPAPAAAPAAAASKPADGEEEDDYDDLE